MPLGRGLATGQQAPDSREAIGGYESSGHAVPQGIFDLGGQASGGGGDLGEEQGAPLPEGVEDVPGRPGDRLSRAG
jgi:hypothetical protein